MPAEAFNVLLHNTAERRKRVETGAALVDGMGAARVSGALTGLDERCFELDAHNKGDFYERQ